MLKNLLRLGSRVGKLRVVQDSKTIALLRDGVSHGFWKPGMGSNKEPKVEMAVACSNREVQIAQADRGIHCSC